MFERRKIERELRNNRAEPTDDFLRLAAGRISVEGATTRRRGKVLRPVVMLSAVAALVSAVGALGGFSSLRSAVGSHHQPFLAANVVYAAPTVTCTLTSADSGGHLQLSITTTLAAGQISATINASPGDPPNWPVTFTQDPVTSLTMTFKTSGNQKERTGHTYTATVTQTADGYNTATTTCSKVGSG